MVKLMTKLAIRKLLSLGMILVVAFLAKSCLGQLASQTAELQGPFNAIGKSTSWMDVLTDDFDLEVTAHYGGTQGKQNDANWETICKCRQVYEKDSAMSFAAWAIGSIEVEVSQGVPSDYRERKGRVVEGRAFKEVDFLTKDERSNVTCGDECLQLVAPLNLLQAVCNHTLDDLTVKNPKEWPGFIEKLATLQREQLTATNERVHGKDVRVFRIKLEPSPKAIAVPAIRIVVSNSGFDTGLVNEIHNGMLKLDDDEKYTDEAQLVEEFGVIHHNIHWKEITLVSKRGKSRKMILPVSVSKNADYSSIKCKRYFNLELNWRSFTKGSQNNISVDRCDKLTEEYLKKIDDTLGR